MDNHTRAVTSFLGLCLVLVFNYAHAADKTAVDKTGLSPTLKACYATCKEKKVNEDYEACMIECKKAEPKKAPKTK